MDDNSSKKLKNLIPTILEKKETNDMRFLKAFLTVICLFLFFLDIT